MADTILAQIRDKAIREDSRTNREIASAYGLTVRRVQQIRGDLEEDGQIDLWGQLAC
jgi:hypothetical protein